jgi:hypothetical protein
MLPAAAHTREMNKCNQPSVSQKIVNLKLGKMFHRNHSQFCNDRMSLIVACSLLADVGISRLSASFTITTNYSMCLEGLLLIIFQHLG